MTVAPDSSTILVVEDEDSFVDALTVGLAREGFIVEVARDGAEAITMFDSVKPDIVLLDVMLPRLNGIDVCRQIRTSSKTPIIMVSAKGSEIDTVVALEVGADDYVVKPFRILELVARIRAVLRRSAEEVVAPSSWDPGALIVGDLILDPHEHVVTVGGSEVTLRLKEFDLLYELLLDVGKVVSRDRLISRVWGSDFVGDTKTLDVHVKRVRAKIEADPANPTRIVTIRGLGYRYERSKA